MPGDSSKDRELAPGTIVHGYSIVRAIGGGQMGDVYEATASDGRRVALKVLRKDVLNDPGVRDRFLREAKICSELRSPNIVPVLDHGIHQGRPLLVMPVLSGSDLETWLDRTGPLRPDVAVTITLQVCDALAAAHARGIVHRDLKPANIFLSEGRASFSAIVCDFGVAKVVDEDGGLTASGAVLGTPLYMASEQMLDSKRVDKRCDVWALGMTLFHMLSGRTALNDVRTIADLVLALSSLNLTSLQSSAPWIGPSLARVVHAALLPRDKRFPQIEQFAAALRRWGPTPADITPATLVSAPADMRGSAAPKATLPRDAAELLVVDDSTVAQPSGPHLPESDSLLGKVLGGKYRLVRKLGTGGMGAVYEGVDPDGQRSAVKVMHADTGRDDDGLRRFTREMKSVRAIGSPHVVKPIDFGVDETEQIPFFVMELLRGRDLSSVINDVGSLAPPVAVELFVQACEALDAAHKMSIIHRDIKPSNLFLHEPGDGTVILKVCDFGIAKRVESDGLDASTELTRTGGLLGSPIYMSPEHAKNAKNVDARSDLWSLGLSLHEALTGMRPWNGCTSVGEVIVAICTEPVPPLSTNAPWVDAGLVEAIDRSLARDANNRWPSVSAFGNAISSYRLGRPVRLEDLRPVDEAERQTSLRAVSVSPPGMVSSGSLGASARPALEASVSLPIQRGGAWRWAAVAGAVVAVIGGTVATMRVLSPSARDGATPTTAVSAPTPPATVDPHPTTSASAVASAQPSAVPSAVPSVVTAPPNNGRGRVPGRPVLGTSTTTTGATGAQAAPPPAGQPATSSTVGRGFTATDLPGN